MDVDHGPQETQPTQLATPTRYADISDHVAFHTTPEADATSPTVTRTMQSPTRTFQTAREEQTTRHLPEPTGSVSPVLTRSPIRSPLKQTPAYPMLSSPGRGMHSSSPKKSSPLKPMAEEVEREASKTPSQDHDDEEAATPSDGSSPIRPVVRKSSLNFASLPAREPLTSKKSLGPRSSRPSNDHRSSYLGQHAGSKSLSHPDSYSDDDEMDIDDVTTSAQERTKTVDDTTNHNKTYTQRLQDQISLLGKSQPNARRRSKSISNATAVLPPAQTAPDTKHPSPVRSPVRSPAKKESAPPTPGAFPEDDDEDDWIAPPAVPRKDDVPSPRPVLPKSHTADVMEGISGADSVGGAEFVLPKQRQGESRPGSPQRPATAAADRSMAPPGHGKSASVSVLPQSGLRGLDASSPKKAVSVSNPAIVSANDNRPASPPKSPSRSFRDSPLKQVKNKLSSIIKSSKGLLASSAVLSAEGKTAMLSPSTSRLGLHAGPSMESLFQRAAPSDAPYPDLSNRSAPDNQSIVNPGSPTRPVSKRTRASIEREKEEKRREKEAAKEARLYAEQMSKLEKAREKEREKARVFSKEQEKTIAMEAKAAEKEQEKAQVAQTPAPKEPSKPTRTSPRKAKAPAETGDVDMVDATTTVPPPSVSRSAGPGQAIRSKEIRRPMKPTKEPVSTKQAPTVIRVNTGSQHSQYRPSNAALASSLRDTLGAPQTQLRSKASQASLHTKPSIQSLKGTTPSGRPKALELAAKRKEQEEREAQRKRDAKLELEKRRQAMQEEERKVELMKRQEAERLKEKEREQGESKKNAQRQAALEKAKQTRAPPPAVRAQPNGPVEYAAGRDAGAEGPPRPPSRLATSNPRPQEDMGRSISGSLAQGAKPATKRPLPQDASDAARNGQVRNGLSSYQAKEAKRRRTSDDFFDELDMESQQPNIKGPPVRPSGGFKKVRHDLTRCHWDYANRRRRRCRSPPTARDTRLCRRRAPRGTSSRRRSLRSTPTALPRAPKRWICPTSPRGRSLLLRTPTLPDLTRRPLVPRRQRTQSLPPRPPGRPPVSRTASRSSCQRSRRTTMTKTRKMPTSVLPLGPTRRISAARSCDRRQWTPARSSAPRRRSSWKRCSTRVRTSGTSSGRARRAPTGAAPTA